MKIDWQDATVAAVNVATSLAVTVMVVAGVAVYAGMLAVWAAGLAVERVRK